MGSLQFFSRAILVAIKVVLLFNLLSFVVVLYMIMWQGDPFSLLLFQRAIKQTVVKSFLSVVADTSKINETRWCDFVVEYLITATNDYKHQEVKETLPMLYVSDVCTNILHIPSDLF